MFRSQLFYHLQGVVFRAWCCYYRLCLFASSSCLFGMWLYVVCSIIFALEWFHDFIYQDMNKMKHMMEKVWTYLCVCVPDVLFCGMFGCKLSLIACGSCASSYNGFGSLTCCSVMSRFCWRYIWMYMSSQLFIFLLLPHGCISFRVSFAE